MHDLSTQSLRKKAKHNKNVLSRKKNPFSNAFCFFKNRNFEKYNVENDNYDINFGKK